MVDYRDLRSTRPTDTLQRIIANLRTPASTPHGIKIASPTEATVYMDSSGQARRWSGDVIADFDARMSEATKIVESARGVLQAAESGLSDARRRIEAVEAATDPQAIGATARSALERSGIPGSWVVPGTLDVRRLNVTDEMAAEIVNAMTANTKKLVVTEDAILQRATVIEGIVTPELVSQRINVERLAASMITAGALQTDARENQGVKIDSTGISAFSEAGEQTVKISSDGSENKFTGVFSTASRDKAGVTIYSTVARGVTGSRASVIEMRPLDADQKAPNGVIRMDPQGALYIGMRDQGAFEYDMKGFFVDVYGGVNITDSLRVYKNMRLEGFISQSKNTWIHSLGPYYTNPSTWTKIPVTWTKTDQHPYLFAQVFTDWDVTCVIDAVSDTGCTVYLYNHSNVKVEGIYVDLFSPPINRNK